MQRVLLLESFAKVAKEFSHLSKTKQAEELSNIIEEHSELLGDKEVLTGKRLTQLKRDAEEGAITMRMGIANALAHYIGYQDFVAYSKAYQKKQLTLKDKTVGFLDKHKITLLVSVVLLVVFLIIGQITKRKWMIWNKDHYEKVDFNEAYFNTGKLKIYEEDLCTKFLKVKPYCKTVFFTANDKPLIWYGKSKNGTYEFFTSNGNHPETGKQLRPITKYMINKYICP
ncbi:hypothetical protein NBRC110019_26610 [Neptunitalea chrysea]|uniref:Uncharacterized protein n=1 Tax=Neptunitalea chrysea TaxID=1647581 RepID=A0A9W6B6T7_9FLAO|nr:hypothetical protein [Neptunitalea chrysea]GLB53620.1 hypothetical protein NBRC110019_26610 [Neptunitalea chrysea]